MAIKLNFFLDGQRIKEPLNYQEVSLELNYDKGNPDFNGEVSVNNWVLGLGDNNDPQDAVKNLLEYAQGGLNPGGVGVFNGVNFDVQLENGLDNPIIYNGYLDLSRGKFTCSQIEAPSSESKNVDFLNEVADSFTFEKLFFDGTITTNDFVYVPYQEYNPADKLRTALIITTLVNIVLQIFAFVAVIEALIDGVKTSKGFGWELVFAIISALLALYALLRAVKAFVEQVIDYLFNETYLKAGMYLHDLCRIGSEYLGYTFESPILDGTDYRLTTGTKSIGFDNVVLIPESYEQTENNKGVLGVDDIRNSSFINGFYRGTFGDLLREIKSMFNAKIIIQDGVNGKVLKIDRIDKPTTTSAYRLPDLDRDNVPFTYNYDELFSYSNIKFNRDDSDKVNLQNYLGTELQYFQEPLIKGVNSLEIGNQLINIGLGLTVIKTELTKQEKFLRGVVSIWYGFISIPLIIIRGLAIAINFLIKQINKILKRLRVLNIYKGGGITPINISNLDNPLDRFRIRFNEQNTGMLLFESHYLSTPRLVALKESYKDYSGGIVKPHLSQRQLLNANYLYENFYYINNFIEDNTLAIQDHNQHIIYELNDVPFCSEDYEKVRASNIIEDSDGVSKGEIISLRWNIYAQKADVKFKIKKKYTNNLEIKDKILSDGR